MANEEHIAVLERGAIEWNLWRRQNPQTKPDFNNADLFLADLSSADFSSADFSNADVSDSALRDTSFRNASLSAANLSGADLTGTDLRNADLSKANLEGTKLNGANLAKADLSDAIFILADLSNANLCHTDLAYANFSNANLYGANVSAASTHSTFWANVNLSEARGLTTIVHLGPSTIGIDTIYKSKGQIPEIFLRGCGVPDIFIEYMHALTARPFEYYSCFISYSHADEAFARRLHDTLQGKGVRCWLDEKDGRLGVPITHNIEHGIRLTDKFLLCCSQESLGSNWVNFEIDLALHRETELRQEAPDNSWRIIPLDLDGHLFSPEYSGEALRIRNRLAGDFTGWKTDSDKFDRQIARVIQAIRIE